MTSPVDDERLAYLIRAHADKDNWGYSPDTVSALTHYAALRRQLAELERLANERGLDIVAQQTRINALQSSLQAAQHRLSEAEKDAERYRWLREQGPMDDITIETSGSSAVWHLSGDVADTAIDAAIAARGKKE